MPLHRHCETSAKQARASTLAPGGLLRRCAPRNDGEGDERGSASAGFAISEGKHTAAALIHRLYGADIDSVIDRTVYLHKRQSRHEIGRASCRERVCQYV